MTTKHFGFPEVHWFLTKWSFKIICSCMIKIHDTWYTRILTSLSKDIAFKKIYLIFMIIICINVSCIAQYSRFPWIEAKFYLQITIYCLQKNFFVAYIYPMYVFLHRLIFQRNPDWGKARNLSLNPTWLPPEEA